MRVRAPPARFTYDGNDFTGSPQELANRTKELPAKEKAAAGRPRADGSDGKNSTETKESHAALGPEEAPAGPEPHLALADGPAPPAAAAADALSGKRLRKPAQRFTSDSEDASVPAKPAKAPREGRRREGQSGSRKKANPAPARPLGQPLAPTAPPPFARAPTPVYAAPAAPAPPLAAGPGFPLAPSASAADLARKRQAVAMSLMDDDFLKGLDHFCASI